MKDCVFTDTKCVIFMLTYKFLIYEVFTSMSIMFFISIPWKKTIEKTVALIFESKFNLKFARTEL